MVASIPHAHWKSITFITGLRRDRLTTTPSELAFAKFKVHIKRLKPRSVEELWKTTGTVCDLFKSEE